MKIPCTVWWLQCIYKGGFWLVAGARPAGGAAKAADDGPADEGGERNAGESRKYLEYYALYVIFQSFCVIFLCDNRGAAAGE